MKAQSTMPLDEPRAGRLTIDYSPVETDEIIENPPRFTWLPVIEHGANYTLKIEAAGQGQSSGSWTFSKLPLNFFTPDITLPPGKYTWCYAVCTRACGCLEIACSRFAKR